MNDQPIPQAKTYDFPTEILELPSKGLLYPKENPLSSGHVTIKYMTAKEEDLLSNQTLIKKGVVLDKLFETIILDNVNPNDILIGDKNAILLATRVLGYGAAYPIKFYSTVTDSEIETEVDLSQVKIKDVDYSLFTNHNEFEFTTPIGKKKITFKLLTHGDEINVERDIQGLRKINKDDSPEMTTRLRYMIRSVDGNTDSFKINSFVNGMLARDAKSFREHVKRIAPDIDMNFEYTHETGEKEVTPIRMGVGFFWPS